MYVGHKEVAKTAPDGHFFYERLVKTLRLAPGEIDGPESHEVQQISMVLSGQGLLSFDSDVRSLSPGSYFLVTPGVTHTIENDGHEDLIILNFYSGNNH